jgi:hypothetical protein
MKSIMFNKPGSICYKITLQELLNGTKATSMQIVKAETYAKATDS